MNVIVGAVVGLIGIAGAIGVALGVLVSKRATTVIELQKETIVALEQQRDEAERRRVAQDGEVSALRDRLGSAEERIRMLTELATGAAKVEALAQLVTARHEEVMMALSALNVVAATRPAPIIVPDPTGPTGPT